MVGGAPEGGAYSAKGEKISPAVPFGDESSTRSHGYLREAEEFGTPADARRARRGDSGLITQLLIFLN